MKKSGGHHILESKYTYNDESAGNQCVANGALPAACRAHRDGEVGWMFMNFVDIA